MRSSTLQERPRRIAAEATSVPLLVRDLDRGTAARRWPTSRRVLVAVVLGVALLAGVVALARGQARIHGIGYSDSLQPGQFAWLYPSWPAYFAKSGAVQTMMSLDAQPFRPGQPQDAAEMARRYGFAPGSITPDGNGSWLVSCDAESIQQRCALWLEEQCRAGKLGGPERYDCSLDWNGAEGWRAQRDAYDYWATHPAGLGAAGGPVSRKPGQPRIDKVTSDQPGRVYVAWTTRRDHTAHAVSVGAAVRVVTGDVFAAIVELPPGLGGNLDVAVTAFYGDTPGTPSLVKTVHVEPREPPPPPAATPTPSPTPEPSATPPPPDRECAANVELWPEWLTFLAKLSRCRP